MRSNTQKFLAAMFLVFQMGGTSAFAQDALEKKLDAAMRAIFSKRTALELGVATTAGGIFLNHMQKILSEKNRELRLLHEQSFQDSRKRLKAFHHEYIKKNYDKIFVGTPDIEKAYLKVFAEDFINYSWEKRASFLKILKNEKGEEFQKIFIEFTENALAEFDKEVELEALKGVSESTKLNTKYYEYPSGSFDRNWAIPGLIEKIQRLKSDDSPDFFEKLVEKNVKKERLGRYVTYGGAVLTVGAFIAMLLEDEHDDVGMRERIERMDAAELRDFLRHNPVLLDLIPKEEKHSPKGNS